MIKLIAFDLDGTLISLPEVHYQTLNAAIEEVAGKEYIITREEHNKIYNGLSSKTKLKMLAANKGLSDHHFGDIAGLKQKYTIAAINNDTEENFVLQNDLAKLKEEGYLLYCASNALFETVELSLKKLGIHKYFDHIVGNDGIKRQKPAPDIYLQCFLHAGVDPKECLIVEDSYHGRMAAVRSGAYLCTIDNETQTTYEHIKKCIDKIKHKPTKWACNKLQVVLAMSGRGSRFTLEGYVIPKPLVDVGDGKSMIQMVVENINIDAEYIFIVQKSHYEQYNLQTILSLMVPGCKIIQVNGITDGAACSVLLAKEYINNNNHLFVINSDQYIKDFDSCDFFNKMLTSNVDGGIMTFKKENDVKWSYVRLNEDGNIIEVREKQPISDQASTGAYYFHKGSDFISAAEEMIENKDKYKNEYYLAPCYNYMIKTGKKIIPYEIPTENFFGTGTPEDLEYFKKQKLI
jgi:beta-phosphoglucomutase-like phosphatase (HAD superfamily)